MNPGRPPWLWDAVSQKVDWTLETVLRELIDSGHTRKQIAAWLLERTGHTVSLPTISAWAKKVGR